MKDEPLYIGIMSGTSLDGIDVVMADFSAGVSILDSVEAEIPSAIRHEIRELNTPCPNDLARSLVLDKQLGRLFGNAVQQLLDKTAFDPARISAIGSHGQTLRHAPSGENGYSLQVGDPNLIAEITGIPVVADFRMRDVAAGGQGAPLVPAFHQAIFSSPAESRAVINIGGMANVTLLHRDGSVGGFDTGPGNVLLDHWCQQHQGAAFDRNGEWAQGGRIIPELLEAMLQESYFHQPPPKSTGREQFDAHRLGQFKLSAQAPEDVQATLLELTARSICSALPEETETLFVCGGGANNLFLMERITKISRKKVQTTEALGIPPRWVEATAFAWLAKQTMEGRTGNLPEVTGACGKRILGGVYCR